MVRSSMALWRSLLVALVLLLAGADIPASGQQVAPPVLVIEADGELDEAAARLRTFDRAPLADVVQFVGLDTPGPPIRVVLVGDRSPLGRRTPDWVAGFAHGPSDTIVLFPSRSPQYPHDSLEAVLHHEVAHILIHRAAGGRGIPRWFSEGLAAAAERSWGLEDRRRLAWALAASGASRMREVDGLFQSGPGEVARAYALSGAFVRDVLDDHGPGTAARILADVRREESFETAFERSTGRSLAAAEDVFLGRMSSWERWIPLVTSPYLLWGVVSALALVAIWKRRQRSAEMRRRWDAEEASAGTGDDDVDAFNKRPGGHEGASQEIRRSGVE